MSAYDDFRELHPKIILTNPLDEAVPSLENQYRFLEVRDGEEATPDTFNRSIMDSINRDLNLETSLTYLARSASFFTTDTTKFLTHCTYTSSGKDVVYNTPVDFSEGTDPSALFIDDKQFLGAAYLSGYTENILGEYGTYLSKRLPTLYTPSTDVEYLSTGQSNPIYQMYGWHRDSENTGWKVYPPLSSEFFPIGDADVIISDSKQYDPENPPTLADNPYVTVSNKNARYVDDEHTVHNPGTLRYYTDHVQLAIRTERGQENPPVPSVVSAGVYLETDDDLRGKNASVILRIEFYTDAKVYISSAEKMLSNVNTFKGRLSLENVAVPESSKYAKVFIIFDFPIEGVEYRFYKIALQGTTTLSAFVEHSKDGSGGQYNPSEENKNLINLDKTTDGGYDCGTLMFWSKFTKYGLNKLYSDNTANSKVIGPVFATFGSNVSGTYNFSLGMVHKRNAASGSVPHDLNLYLYLNETGKQYPTFGTEIAISEEEFDKYLDKYILCALRFRPGDPTITYPVVDTDPLFEAGKVTPVGTENPKELGWYYYDMASLKYLQAEEEEVLPGKDYYISPSPIEQGWYEFYGSEYVLSLDTRVKTEEDKQYFTQEEDETIYPELAVVLNDRIVKSYFTNTSTGKPQGLSKTLFGDRFGTILLGSDRAKLAADTQYSHIYPLNGMATELRYDGEWINDAELYLMSICSKPYSYKQLVEKEEEGSSSSEEEIAVISEPGINLLANPTGKYGLTSWTASDSANPEESSFKVRYQHPTLGTCFHCIQLASGQASKKFLYSDVIEIETLSSPTFSLRFLGSALYSTGAIGVGVRLMSSKTEEFDTSKTPAMNNDMFLTIDGTGSEKYYKGSIYHGGKSYARVYIYIAPNTNISDAYITKIKFEKGVPTTFTDDSSANYAVYY